MRACDRYEAVVPHERPYAGTRALLIDESEHLPFRGGIGGEGDPIRQIEPLRVVLAQLGDEERDLVATDLTGQRRELRLHRGDALDERAGEARGLDRCPEFDRARR